MEHSNRQRVNFTLSPEAIRLLELLAQQLGISRTAVIELAIRALAQQERLT